VRHETAESRDLWARGERARRSAIGFDASAFVSAIEFFTGLSTQHLLMALLRSTRYLSGMVLERRSCRALRS
jgi:hypothetical protein